MLGRDLLLAVVMGYEVSARIGRATKMRVSVHPHGTCGVIGSAVAAAHMKGLDEAGMRHVINVAATMAMATNRQAMLDEATVRNVYSGHSALAGLNAVQLVEAGITGQRDGIGFTYGTVIADGFDPDRMIEGLGRDWLITQGYFKLHPSGRYSHAAIDALQAALATLPQGRLDVASIERIEVRAFQMAALLSGKNITTSFGAKFSIPFALSTILVHGRSGIDCFDKQAVQNPRGAGARREGRCQRRACLHPGLSRQAAVRRGDPSQGGRHGSRALRDHEGRTGATRIGRRTSRRSSLI